MTVVTAAQGTYEQTLMSEMAKEEAPTLFQVNGPVGLANWKDYCYDLSGSAVYGELSSEDFALKEGDTVYGIAYVIETYGIIVNKALLQKAGYTMEDITNFETLKAVAEDITARKDELGFSAFTSAGMDSSSAGASRPTLPTCPFTMSIRQTASAPPLPSREPTLTTIRQFGIFTSTTQPARPLSLLQRPAPTQLPNSIRTAPGPMAMFPPWAMRTSACCRSTSA